MDRAQLETLNSRWAEVMRQYAGFLNEQQSRRIEMALTLTTLELPNLFALLDHVERAGDVEATIDLATSLYGLLQPLGRPRLSNGWHGLATRRRQRSATPGLTRAFRRSVPRSNSCSWRDVWEKRWTAHKS